MKILLTDYSEKRLVLFTVASVFCDPMKRKNAFTLIELLVVISIIALLAGFALPALLRAMERGRATQDANNLNQLGKGFVQYLNDSDDSMFSLKSSGDDTWSKVMQRKYVQGWNSYRSPFDKPSDARPKTDEGSVPISYGINEKLFDTLKSKWKAPQSTLIFAGPAVEKTPGKQIKWQADAFSTQNCKIQASGGSEGFGTHQERDTVNVLFADAHTEAMSCKAFADDSSVPKGKQRWDPEYEQE